MPKMYGPDTPMRIDDGYTAPLEVVGATIGDAIGAYEKAFGVSLTPYDGRWDWLPFDPTDPKYFIYRSKRPKWEEAAVDVHVERGDGFICVRQDLTFALVTDDKIHIVAPAC